MFGSKHYVPVLKGKGGELASLRDLEEAVKDGLTPLIEVMPVPWDFENEEPAKTLDQHLEPLAEKIAKNWGTKRPVFIDAPWTPAEDLTAVGLTALASVLEDARRVDLMAIPVTSIDRSIIYQAAVREVIAKDGRGVCIRLATNDFDDLTALSGTLATMLEDLKVTPDQVDLLIDFRAMGRDQVTALSIAATAMINGLANISMYRTVTLAASAFPQNLTGMKADSITRLDRAEWDLWSALWAKKKSLRRMPTFGDYAIAHPDQAEDMDPRIMQMSAQLRYTTDSDYLVLKGKNVREHGFEQFNGLCVKLVAGSDFSGRRYSWGDTYIDECAKNNEGPGNATTWRRVGTTHHLTLVTRQIASLP